MGDTGWGRWPRVLSAHAPACSALGPETAGCWLRVSASSGHWVGLGLCHLVTSTYGLELVFSQTTGSKQSAYRLFFIRVE